MKLRMALAILAVVGCYPMMAQAQSEADIYRMVQERKQASSQQNGQQNYTAAPSQQTYQHNYTAAPNQNGSYAPSSGAASSPSRGAMNMAGWQSVGTPGVFSASMPGHPVSKATVTNGISSTEWSSDSSEPMHLYSLVVVPYSKGTVSGRNPDEILFSTMKGRANVLGVNPSRKRRIDNGNCPGCLFDMVTADSEWNFMVRIKGDTIYTLSVCSMPGEGNDQCVKQFFDSFYAQ